MDLDDMVWVLKYIQYPGYTFEIVDLGTHLYLQASFHAPDEDTGTDSIQRTRKWLLSRHMTKSELVQTALKCVLTSVEHEAREQFRYRDEAVFRPHFDVEALHQLCSERRLEKRQYAVRDLNNAR